MSENNQDEDIVINIYKNFDDITLNLPEIEKLARFICCKFDLEDTTINIAIVDNAEIKKLNKRFLDKNSITDCLSFDLSDKDTGKICFELVVNGQKAIEEAGQRGHSSQAELALYITHGLLHNLGHDDLLAEKADKMHKAEDEILQQCGFGRIYNS